MTARERAEALWSGRAFESLTGEDLNDPDGNEWCRIVAEAIEAAERAAYDRAKKAALDHANCRRPAGCLHCLTARHIAEDIAALAEEVAK